MFGYVLPCRETLEDGEWNRYQETYCGICHALCRNYGQISRLLLSFDYTFLALLLQAQQPEERRCRRCISHPCKGRCVRDIDAVSDLCADVTVLFSYWKFRDTARDNRGWKRLAAKLLQRLFQGKFRRAVRRQPDVAQTAQRCMQSLWEMERENCGSIDQTAHTFAELLAAPAAGNTSERRERTLSQILYHVGRWIYLIDAWDDLEEDLRFHRYNPVAVRFSITAGDKSSLTAAREQLELTLKHSLNLALSAFHLTDPGPGGPIVENILCHGLPVVQALVFSGRWKEQKKLKKTGAIKYE